MDGNRPIATVFDEIKEVIYATKGTIALSALGPSIIKKPPLRVIMSGPPASGKGTQCDLLVKEFRFTHIGVGDLLRLEVACESEIGRKAKEYMEAGNLVPDEVIIKMVKLRLAQTDCIENGFLLDGCGHGRTGERRGAQSAVARSRAAAAAPPRSDVGLRAQLCYPDLLRFSARVSLPSPFSP